MERSSVFLKTLAQCFVLLGIFFLPFDWELLSFHSDLVRTMFLPLIHGIADLLDIQLILSDLSSDSKGTFILFGIIFILSLLTAGWIVLKTTADQKSRLEKFIRILASYYLSLILLKYGLDKILKTQFYLPEPNILFTPLGKLDKDILYWSTMGSSYSYNVFIGLAEIIPAVLLLIPRTRQLGALIASGVLINVVAVNLSFDISVKLFSSFLLMISIFLSVPLLRSLIRNECNKRELGSFNEPAKRSNLRLLVQYSLLCIFFMEALLPVSRIRSWNDDLAPRPYLHGAYDAVDQTGEIKRLFIHRDGYLIFQDQSDVFSDFHLEIDTKDHLFHLQDHDLRRTAIPYRSSKNSDSLAIRLAGKEVLFTINYWKDLPLMKQQFHWTVD